MDIVTNDYIQNKYRENLFYFHPLSKWEDAVVLALASYKCGVGVQPVVEINQSSPSLDGEGWDGVINLVEEVLHLLAWRCQYKYGREV